MIRSPTALGLAGLLAASLLSCSPDLQLPSGDRPPELGLVSPCRGGVASPCQDNAVVTGDVVVEVARSGGGQLSAVELFTPGVAVQKLTAPPWSWTIDTRALYPVGGVMPVYLTPIDSAGVRASQVQFSFVVDNAGPALSIAAPTHDTTWPMTLAIPVSVCADDVQGVAGVVAVVGQASSPLTASGTCADGRAQYVGTIAAPSGGENTLPFDLSVQATDSKGNGSSVVVPLTAARQRWSRVVGAPAAFFGGATAPVPQGVQHAFRAYDGGVVMQTNNTSSGYVFWLPADGSAGTSLAPALTRFGFSPYQSGNVATLISGVSGSSLTIFQPAGTVASATSGTDWGGISELAGFGDQVACFATDQNNFNPLFKRMACLNAGGTVRFSVRLDQTTVLTDDIAALAVAGDVTLVLREPAGCSGILFDRYSAAGALLAGSPCISGRPLHPYVHADAFGAVVTTSLLSAQVDTAGGVTDVTSRVATLGALLARGPGGRLLWALNDATLLGTTVTLTDATGATVIGRASLPFRASAPAGFSPAGGFDAFQSDAAAFDTTGNSYAALLESTLNGPIFHVLSFDPGGALRWQYTTGALLALSLSPTRTSEPVYLLQADGTIQALVR